MVKKIVPSEEFKKRIDERDKKLEEINRKKMLEKFKLLRVLLVDDAFKSKRKIVQEVSEIVRVLETDLVKQKSLLEKVNVYKKKFGINEHTTVDELSKRIIFELKKGEEEDVKRHEKAKELISLIDYVESNEFLKKFKILENKLNNFNSLNYSFSEIIELSKIPSLRLTNDEFVRLKKLIDPLVETLNELKIVGYFIFNLEDGLTIRKTKNKLSSIVKDINSDLIKAEHNFNNFINKTVLPNGVILSKFLEKYDFDFSVAGASKWLEVLSEFKLNQKIINIYSKANAFNEKIIKLKFELFETERINKKIDEIINKLMDI